MESIFKSQPHAGRPAGPLEVKAGRMVAEEHTIRPLATKGKITVGKEADGLVHFKWVNVQSGQEELDIVVIPEDARFMKAVQAKGRVYILELSGRREFFWLQEPDKDKDAEIVKKLNVAMGTANFSGLPSAPEEAKAAPPAQPVPGISQEQLQEMLKMLSQQLEPGPGLDEVLTPEVLDRLARDPQVVQRVGQHMPAEQSNPEDVSTNLHSPQLRQALQLVTSALHSAGAANVLHSLGVGEFLDPQARGDVVEELLRAIERRARSRQPPS